MWAGVSFTQKVGDIFYEGIYDKNQFIKNEIKQLESYVEQVKSDGK